MRIVIIDPRKVNLSEKDIEDWLWENPGAVTVYEYAPVAEWTHRQFKLPSGVADLVGVTDYNHIVVVEVKNTPIGSDALAQVSRYAADIGLISRTALENDGLDRLSGPSIMRIVIGKSIDKATMLEAEALGVIVHVFDVSLTLTVTEIINLPEDFTHFRDSENDSIGRSESGHRLIRRHLAQYRDINDDAVANDILSFLDSTEQAAAEE